MLKKIYIVTLLFLSSLTTLVYFRSFSIFFLQDDFILISEFSKNALLKDFVNALGPANVTHWRPLHNLFFLLGGNLFNTNYFLYHSLSIAILIGSSFVIYLFLIKLVKNKFAAFAGSAIYTTHSSHFVAVSWISGGATLIAFFFFITSFYFFISSRRMHAIILFTLSIMASEAFLAGLIVLWIWSFFTYRLKDVKNFLITQLVISAIFVISKILLTKVVLGEVYNIEFSTNVLIAFKYYILRILNFGETSSDLAATAMLSIAYSILLFFILRQRQEINFKILSLGVITLITGLFPFVLLPIHLSPHYINLSIFGLIVIICTFLSKTNTKVSYIFVTLFLLSSLLNVRSAYLNNWVISRSYRSEFLIKHIEQSNLPTNSSILITGDSQLGVKETYIVLGGGSFTKLFFSEKNYSICFWRFEKCESLP